MSGEPRSRNLWLLKMRSSTRSSKCLPKTQKHKNTLFVNQRIFLFKGQSTDSFFFSSGSLPQTSLKLSVSTIPLFSSRTKWSIMLAPHKPFYQSWWIDLKLRSEKNWQICALFRRLFHLRKEDMLSATLKRSELHTTHSPDRTLSFRMMMIEFQQKTPMMFSTL